MSMLPTSQNGAELRKKKKRKSVEGRKFRKSAEEVVVCLVGQFRQTILTTSLI